MQIEQLLLIPVGIVIASFASLIGIGGGLIWAPFLILVLGLEPQLAVMFSFLIQFAGMGSATYSNIKNKLIFWNLAILLFFPIFTGIIIGAFINQNIYQGIYIKLGLGILCIVVSLLFAFQSESYNLNLNENPLTKPPVWLRLQSIIWGIISGLFSIGTSDFLIPVIRSRLKIPMQYAVGTCILLNFSLSLMGGIIHIIIKGSFPFDKINILLLSWIGVLIGGQLGPKLSARIGDNRLKEIFIFALLLLGIHLIYQSL